MPASKHRIVGKRANLRQKEALLSYLEQNPSFAHFLTDSPNGAEALKLQWEELADHLNSIPGEGATKNGISWRKYWLDLREYTKLRVTEREQKDPSGSARKKPICHLEKRIMDIINWKVDLITNDTQIKLEHSSGGGKSVDLSRLSQASRIKNGRASDLQKEELVKYFEENPKAIDVLLHAPSDTREKHRIWIELTHRLNEIDGVMKPSLKWMKYWNDIVAYTKSRAKKVVCGQINGFERPPTDLEKRMLRVVQQDDLVDEWTKTTFDQHLDVKNVKEIKEEIQNDTMDDDNDDEEQESMVEWAVQEEFSIADDEGSLAACSSITKESNQNCSADKHLFDDDGDGDGEEHRQDDNSGYLDDSNVYFEVTEDPTEDEVINEYKIAKLDTNSSSTSTEIHVEIQEERPSQRNEINPDTDIRVEENDEDAFEDNLTDALYHLGTATQQLANALHSVSNVLMNRKQSKAKRARYY